MLFRAGPGSAFTTVTLGLCSLPSQVLAVDLDVDGDHDLVVACSDSIVWFENTATAGGAPSFLSRTVAFSNAGASAIHVFDYNKDGQMDIVASSFSGSTVTIFVNAGRQVYTSLIVTTSQAGVSGVVGVDLDKDGDSDVVFVSATSNKVAWMENIGANFFAENVIAAGVLGASGLTVADLNGDLSLDVLVSAATDAKVTLYVNSGRQLFTARTVGSGLSGAADVLLVDVDQDGDMDVVVSSTSANEIAWFENYGSLVFVPRSVAGGVTQVTSCVPADVDGDGDVDFVAASSLVIGAVTWYENTWTPTLTVSVPPWNSVSSGMPAVGNVITVQIVESNGISTLTADPSCTVNSQNVTAKFKASGQGKYSFNYTVAAGDEEWPWLGLNLRLALTNTFGRSLVISRVLVVGATWLPSSDSAPVTASRLAYTYLGTSSPLDRLSVTAGGALNLQLAGAITNPASKGLDMALYSGTPAFIVTSDFNNDLTMDVAVFGTDGSSVLFIQGSDGNFGRSDPVNSPFPDIGGCSLAIAVDVNVDGWVDIVAVGSTGSTAVLINDAGSLFNDETDRYLGDVSSDRYTTVIAADFSGDNIVDLFFIGGSGTPCELFVNQPALTLMSRQATSRQLHPALLSQAKDGVVLDANGDGFVDLFVACNGANRLFLNDGMGRFNEVGAAAGIADGTMNSDSVDVGDVDMDGDVDIFVSNSGAPSRLFINNGTGVFTDAAPAWGVTASGSALFVDVDGDGDLDLPAVGLLNPRVPVGRVPNILIVSPLSRAGIPIQAGARVSLTTVGGARIGTGFACAGCRKHQGPYDVYFAVPSASTPCNITIAFVDGVVLNPKVVPDMGSVVPTQVNIDGTYPYTASLASIPFVSSVSMSPVNGTLGIGDTVELTIVAGYGEAGLGIRRADVNGGDVASSFLDLGNGEYSLEYTVQRGDLSFGPGNLTVRLALFDMDKEVSSPTVTQSSLPPAQRLAVDSQPPVLLVSGPRNGTAVKSAYATIQLTCADPGPSASGCVSYWFVEGANPPQLANVTGPNSAEFVVGPFVSGYRPYISAWTFDAGNNLSPAVSLNWIVDLNWPVSTWSGIPPPLTNQTSVHLTFTCEPSNCAIEYTLDDEQSVWINGFGNSTTQLGLGLDTTIIQMPRYFTNATVATFIFHVNDTGDVAPPDLSQSSLQFRLEGASAWVDCRDFAAYDRVTHTLTMSNLTEGVHEVQARAVLDDAEFDITPVTIRWTVDRTPPTVRFVVSPPATGAKPAGSAWFVYKASEGVSWFQHRQNTTGAWTTSRDDSFRVGPYQPGSNRYFEVRAIDYANNTGPSIVWRWNSSACPPTAPTLTLKSVPVSVGRRVFVWKFNVMTVAQSQISYTFAYRIDGGAWTNTSKSMADVTGIEPALAHSFDVVVVPVWDCGLYTVASTLFSTQWYEYDASPGLPAFVSTPELVTTSVFPKFEMNSTAKLAWFMYSMDGSSWQRCASPLQLGPLPSGNHSMSVRAIDMHGSPSNVTITYNWTIVPSTDTMLTLSGMADGPHTFVAYAVDSAGNEEPPHTFEWTVDTVVPKTFATLLSPSYSNQANVSVQMWCDDENATALATSACLFCWTMDASLKTDCGRSTLVKLPSAEGSHTLSVVAYDAAGNQNKTAIVLAWTTDFSPPTTLLTLVGLNSTYVAALSKTVVTTPYVTISVSAALSKPVKGFTVFSNGLLLGSFTGTLRNVSIPDGPVTLLVKAVDLAGNVDPVGASTSMLVDTTAPTTIVDIAPPAFTNTTTLTLRFRGVENIINGLAGFQLTLTPPSVSVPALVTPTAVNTSVVTLTNVPPGRYNLTARAVDVVGWVDRQGVSVVFTVDVTPPTSSFVLPVPAIVSRNDVTLRTTTTDSQSNFTTFYRLNGGAWLVVAASTVVLTGLPEGTASVEMRSVDFAGNMERMPYANVSFVVDTIPPVMSWTARPNEWNNNTFVQPCVSAVDASRVTVTAWLDDQRVPVNPDTLCAPSIVSQQGRHVFVFACTDAAGNAGTNLTHTWFLDTSAPAAQVVASGCNVYNQKTVCNSTSAFQASMACDVDAASVTWSIAPCSISWQLQSYVNQSAVCGVSSTSVSSGQSNVSEWSVLGASGLVAPVVPSDGRYDIHGVASDLAGNVNTEFVTEFWVDTSPPPPPTMVALSVNDTQASMLATRSVHVQIQLAGDTSPGQSVFVYNLTTGGNPYNDKAIVSTLPVPNSAIVELVLTDLVPDTSYELRVWARDQAGSESQSFMPLDFVILSSVPTLDVIGRPAEVSADQQPEFQFKATWGEDSTFSNISLRNVSFEVQLDSGLWKGVDVLGCNMALTEPVCNFTSDPVTPGTHTLQVRTVLSGKRSDPKAVTWEYRQCTPIIQYNYILPNGNLDCRKCETGMDCSNPAAVVASRGFWTLSPSSLQFYQCPVAGACLGGDRNGSIAKCATGYIGLLCATCDTGYFQQYDSCIKCPKDVGMSAAMILAVSVAFIVAGYILFKLREVLPIVQIKVGVSMLQVLAAGNAAYNIPWPSAFSTFLNYIKVVLVDIAGLVPANCTQSMDYYKSLLIELLAFKGALILILLGPWVFDRIKNINCSCTRRAGAFFSRFRKTTVKSAQNKPEEMSERDAQLYGWPTEAVKVTSLRESLLNVKQSKLFRMSFMFLFLAYPGVTLKIFRMFKCRNINGTSYLVADLRLQCYTAKWGGYAIYAGVMGLLYAFGLPAAVMWILYRRRHKLFGLRSPETRAKWGFLYESYGSTAWWWEVEELVRKLILSCVVVLMDEGTPLQVSVAVLISGWAHVLHATYKPWGRGTPTYMLQHISLFVTFFVFLMGLLFKVNSVGQSSPTFTALSIIMLFLCIGFMVAWVVLMGKVVHENFTTRRMANLLTNSKNAMKQAAEKGDGGGKDAMRAIQNPMVRRAMEMQARKEGKAAASVPYLAPSGANVPGAVGSGMMSNPLLSSRGGGGGSGGEGKSLPSSMSSNPLLRMSSMRGGLDGKAAPAGGAVDAVSALRLGKSLDAVKLTRNVQRQARTKQSTPASSDPNAQGVAKGRVLKRSVSGTARPAAFINPDMLRRLEEAEAPPGVVESPTGSAKTSTPRSPNANPLLMKAADSTVNQDNVDTDRKSAPSGSGNNRILAGRGVSKLRAATSAATTEFSGSNPLATRRTTGKNEESSKSAAPAVDPLNIGSNPLFVTRRGGAAGTASPVPSASNPKPASATASSLMIARSGAVSRMMAGGKAKPKLRNATATASGDGNE